MFFILACINAWARIKFGLKNLFHVKHFALIVSRETKKSSLSTLNVFYYSFGDLQV